MTETADERPKRTLHDTSGPAIAATAALVLFSVFIGVFGPRIGNRQQIPTGVTLVELASAVVSRSQPQFDQPHLSRAEELTDQEFTDRIEELVGEGVALPTLEALRLAATLVQPVVLPGGRGGIAVIRSTDPRRRLIAAVAIIKDEDRLTVYDRYSRPVPLPTGEVFTVPGSDESGGGVVEIYREGELVIAVRAPSPEWAAEIVAAMQSASAIQGFRRSLPPERSEPEIPEPEPPEPTHDLGS